MLFSLEHRDLELPVSYSVDECVDLAPFMALQNPHDRPALVNWLDTRFTQRPVRMLEFMQALSTAINTEFEYSARDELGTQSVAQTIAAGSGTCPGFRVLLHGGGASFRFRRALRDRLPL